MQDIIARVDELPTLTPVVRTLTLLLDAPETGIQQVTDILSEDQAMTVKILRLANSAYYGFSGTVSTVGQAVVLLGFSTVRDIVVSSAIFDMFGGGSKRMRELFDVRAFWVHSVGVAVACRLLAREYKICDPEEAFASGLLHDIGKLVMLQYMRPEFLQILSTVNTRDILFLDAERELSLSHAGLGRYLVQAWNLPTEISDAVGFHHSIREHRPTVARTAIVQFADAFVRARGVGCGGDRRIAAIDATTWKVLELDINNIEDIIAMFDEEMLSATVVRELFGAT